MRSEASYQAGLIKTLERLFPGCFIQKNDPALNQGIPDLIILWEGKWAMLEVKKSASEPYRPNQEHYIARFNEMSFASAIYPENEDEVLDDLQQAFRN